MCSDMVAPHRIQKLLRPILAQPWRSSFWQPEQPGFRRLKAAVAIKAGQMWLVIDMQPVYTALACHYRGLAHQRATNPTALPVGVYGRVQQKGVDAAIPGHIDKADQPVALVCADICQAAAKDWLEVARCICWPGGSEQSVERIVAYCRADSIDDWVGLPE